MKQKSNAPKFQGHSKRNSKKEVYTIYLKKQEKYQPKLTLKELEKVSRRQEIKKNREEINEIEMKKNRKDN